MVRITNMFTMDPGDVWTTNDVFFPNDPFGINILVYATPEVVEERLRYDLIFHMVNPGTDPFEPNWFSILSGDVVGYDTIDWHVNNSIFQWQNFSSDIAEAGYRQFGLIGVLRLLCQ